MTPQLEEAIGRAMFAKAAAEGHLPGRRIGVRAQNRTLSKAHRCILRHLDGNGQARRCDMRRDLGLPEKEFENAMDRLIDWGFIQSVEVDRGLRLRAMEITEDGIEALDAPPPPSLRETILACLAENGPTTPHDLRPMVRVLDRRLLDELAAMEAEGLVMTKPRREAGGGRFYLLPEGRA